MKRIFNQLRKVHIAGLAGLVLLVALLAFLSVSPVRAEGDQRLSYNLAEIKWRWNWGDEVGGKTIGGSDNLSSDFSMDPSYVNFNVSQQSLDVKVVETGTNAEKSFAANDLFLAGDKLVVKNPSITPTYNVTYRRTTDISALLGEISQKYNDISGFDDMYQDTLTYIQAGTDEIPINRAYALGSMTSYSASGRIYAVKNGDADAFSESVLSARIKDEIGKREASWVDGLPDEWSYVAISEDFMSGRTWVSSQSTQLENSYWAAVESYMQELGATRYSDGVTLATGDKSVTFYSFTVPDIRFYYNYTYSSNNSFGSTYEYYNTLLYEKKTFALDNAVGNYSLDYSNISASTVAGKSLSLYSTIGYVQAVATSMHPHDMVVLEKSGSTGLPSNVKLQYNWSGPNYAWYDYTPGSYLKPWEGYGGTARNLYVRLSAGRGRNGPAYRIFLSKQTVANTGQAGNVLIAPETSDVEVTSVDKGTEITLTYTPANQGREFKILYTTDGTDVELTPVEIQDNIKRLEQNAAGQGLAGAIWYLKEGNYIYLRINGIWYRCNSSVQIYNGPWKVDSSIRKERQLIIKTLAVEDGVLNGELSRYRYKYTLGSAVENPVAVTPSTDADGNMTEVTMGSSLAFTCSTAGNTIFYTLNGSTPVLKVEDGKVLPANEYTYEYTNPIIINESFATYGRTIQVTLIAVAYDEDGNKVREDSEAVQYKYKVADLAAVEKVYSVPAASSEQTQTEVKEGDQLQLFCATENAKIYYTLDGTEPAFDDEGKPLEGTYEYNPGVGVIVPPQADSLFTLGTVAIVEIGGAKSSSGFERLVYKYPAGIAAPYTSPAAGAVVENTQVTLKSRTDGALIYYTTDGTEPTTSSHIYDEQSPIVITEKTTIKAIAVKDGRSSAAVSVTYTVSSKLAAPTPSITGSSVVSKGTIVTLTAETGATIYYTVDGSNPADPENTGVSVGNMVILDGEAGSSVTIRTYAAKTNFSNSAVASYSYTISNYEGGIFPDRENGSILRSGDAVHLNTDVTGAVIYFTTDGTNPTTSSAQGNTVIIGGNPGANVIVKAIAVPAGSQQVSAAATFTYQIMGKSKLPQSSVPTGAVFTETGSVVLSAEAGNIYYTLDGSTPTSGSSLYKEPITITKGVVIKAITIADELDQSDVATFVYSFANQVETPQISYASGELEIGTKVEFTCGTEGASIYYTTNGTEPNTNERSKLTLYTGPIEVNKAVTFKVVAVKDRMQDSKVVSAGYTVREPIVEVIEEEEETYVQTESSGRLQSRRDYSNTEAGPSYTDVVLRNATYGAIVAAEEGTLPDDIQLVVEKVPPTTASTNLIKQMLNETYGVAASYEVQLLKNGEPIQPEGEIEIGLPIPVEYENSMVNVVSVADDGTVETFTTRRVGGVAYAKTSHLSVYSLAVPMEFEEEKESVPLDVIFYLAAVALVGAGGWFLLAAGKRKKKEEGGK